MSHGHSSILERMGAVRPEYKHELEAQLVGVSSLGVTRKAVLPTDLAEFARPVGEQRREAGVGQIGLLGAPGAVKPPAHGPAAREAVLSGGKETKCALRLKQAERRELIALAPDQFAARQEGMGDGAAQRLPAKSCVHAVQCRVKVRRERD